MAFLNLKNFEGKLRFLFLSTNNQISLSTPNFSSKLQRQYTYEEFSEKLTFLHPDMHTFVCVSAYQGKRNIAFFG